MSIMMYCPYCSQSGSGENWHDDNSCAAVVGCDAAGHHFERDWNRSDWCHENDVCTVCGITREEYDMLKEEMGYWEIYDSRMDEIPGERYGVD